MTMLAFLAQAEVPEQMSAVVAPDLWAVISAALVPIVSAGAISPEVTTARARTVVALLLVAAIGVGQAAVETEAGDFRVWVSTFGVGVVTQLASYMVAKNGLGVDLNQIVLPGVGFKGRPQPLDD